MGSGVLQILITLIVLMLFVKPLGVYMVGAFSAEDSRLNRFFNPVERWIYRLAGLKETDATGWKKYALNLLLTNAVLMGIAYLLLRLQGMLPFNPNEIEGMEPTLSFNTAASFMTNTNLQHYSGESDLSHFSQMAVIMMMMFTAPATALAAVIAFIRGLASKGKTIGNFFVDFVRAHTRILLPLAIVVTLLLVALGVPNTLNSNVSVTTLEGVKQTIALGPVAALESIKHIGNNGGGFFGVNSSHPFENPNGITNLIEILCMLALPAALPFTFGKMVGNMKQGWVLFTTVMVLFLVLTGVLVAVETAGNPALTRLGLSDPMGSMEGKEVRFGPVLSAFFASVTTAAETGSVNTMHDTLTPLGGLVTLSNMMLNTVFGGVGAGFLNILLYAILAVFLGGLMVGRSPEFLGRKIEPREMKWIVLVLLAHPLLILVPTAVSFLTPWGTEAISNGGFHGISQVLYELTTSAVNNGSGFEGLNDQTPYWNIMTGVVMLFGRYLSIVALLAVAGSLAAKQKVPASIGTFPTDNATFGTVLAGTILIIGALTFLPVLVLGPVAEFLSLR